MYINHDIINIEYLKNIFLLLQFVKQISIFFQRLIGHLLLLVLVILTSLRGCVRSFTLLDPITGRELQIRLQSPRFWRFYNYYNFNQNFFKYAQNDTETTTTTESPKLEDASSQIEADILPTFSPPEKKSKDAKNVEVVGTGREYFAQDGITPIYKIKQKNPYGH